MGLSRLKFGTKLKHNVEKQNYLNHRVCYGVSTK